MSEYDAVIVGAGPNGLAAAVELTRSDRRVLVVEGADVIGGGTRTEALTSPGFLHDVCSAIHPMGAASPFFRSIGVGDWIHPEIPLLTPSTEEVSQFCIGVLTRQRMPSVTVQGDAVGTQFETST
jgi:phytoene dehydrogenase-like protein